MTSDARDFRPALAAVLRARLGVLRQNPMDVSHKIDIKYHTLLRIFAGDRDPTVYELRRIADALDVPYEVLVAQADQYIADEKARNQAIKQRTNDELG